MEYGTYQNVIQCFWKPWFVDVSINQSTNVSYHSCWIPPTHSQSKTAELSAYHVRYSLWEMWSIHRMVGTFLTGLIFYFFRRILKMAPRIPTAIFWSYKPWLWSERTFDITYFFNNCTIIWLRDIRPIQSITYMLLSHGMMWKHSGEWGESMCTYTYVRTHLNHKISFLH
jgi:hypothetical protein